MGQETEHHGDGTMRDIKGLCVMGQDHGLCTMKCDRVRDMKRLLNGKGPCVISKDCRLWDVTVGDIKILNMTVWNHL